MQGIWAGAQDVAWWLCSFHKLYRPQKDTICTCVGAGTIGGAWRAAKPALEKLPIVLLLLLLPVEAFARPVEGL